MPESTASLAGRSAIITGASRGLGQAIATHFVRTGASVLLVARSQPLLLEVQAELAAQVTQPGQVIASIGGDVSDPASCAAIVQHARETLPGLDILVNNAGVYGPMGRLEDVDWDEWLAAIQINLFGVAQMCRQVIPLLRAQNYGKIINLSGGGATSPMPRISAYAASKAAVVRLSETLAQELSEDHIDVNALAPGALNTRMLDELLAAGPERVGQAHYTRALKQREEGGSSLSRAADLAVFLASSASDGISGRLISAVWDDWPSLPERREHLQSSDIYTLRRIVPQDRGESWE